MSFIFLLKKDYLRDTIIFFATKIIPLKFEYLVKSDAEKKKIHIRKKKM